jgi:2-polyprenyl-3-methyl-5-hydroxy-6-metoxy-1,4-benzoquinol methylase
MMIENEGVRVKDTRCCLLCGGEGEMLYSGLRDRLFSAPGSWSLIQCPKCQLVWLNPRPIPDDIGKLYSQYFTHQMRDAPKIVLAGLRKSVKASILQYSFGYQMVGSSSILGSVLSRIGPLEDIAGGNVRYLKASEKGRLLDVGCGNGIFLDQMRHLGWNVAGVEPDGEAVSVAYEKFGLEIFHGSLEEAKFPDGHFDAITMNHVIEHVLDPIGLLKECGRVLRQGGKLVVVTPNIKSLGRRMLSDAWLAWDPPRHLFLFSSQALRASAERAGLVIRELRTTAKGARWIWVASSLIKRDRMLIGVSPKVPGPSLRLQGLAFQVVEHANGSEAGEELILTATR